jgi:GNAT superfamily N-acetyltransferase
MALDSILIRPVQPGDAPAMDALFREVFDPGAAREACIECLFAEHFRHHLTLFPEGQFAAIDIHTNRLVGYSNALRTSFDPAHPHLEPWWQSIGEGWFSTHQPDGDWLYAALSIVQAGYRGHGIGRRLMDARWELTRRLNLRGILAGSLPIDYGAVAERMTIDDYVAGVVRGDWFDTNLSKQLRMGFRPVQVIPAYVTDTGSRGYGVLILCANEDFRE